MKNRSVGKKLRRIAALGAACLVALGGEAWGAGAANPARVKLAAVGDLMCHDSQLASAFRGPAGYDFRESFACVRPILSRADLVIGNLETVFGGKNSPYTGYPAFNSPDTYADALCEAGFTLLTVANNHSLDRMSCGLQRTVRTVDALGLLREGCGPLKPSLAPVDFPPFCQVEGDDYDCLVEIKGIRIAFLAFTQLLNFPLPPSATTAPQEDDRARLKTRLEKLRSLPPGRRPDLIIVSVHWGNEYQPKPSPTQRATAKWLAENGVDVVLGSHPHILQPVEWIQVHRSGGDASCLVLYSLGNFVSGQRTVPRERSAIVWLELEKSPKGIVTIAQRGFVPTVVRLRKTPRRSIFEIIPASEGLSRMPGGWPLVPPAVVRGVEKVLALPAEGFVRLEPAAFYQGLNYCDPAFSPTNSERERTPVAAAGVAQPAKRGDSSRSQGVQLSDGSRRGKSN